MKNASTLRGVTRPVFPGAKVAVQRLDGSRWTTVVRAPVDARGRFDARLALSPGDYRARLAPGRGFVPGVSPHAPRGPGMRRLALAAFLLALVAPAPASAARYAVGLQKDASPQARRTADRGSHRPPGLGDRALRPDGHGRRAPLASARFAASAGSSGSATTPAASRSRRTTRSPCASGTSTASMLSRPGASCRSCPSVRVAVIDSGIDAEHPELKGQIAAGASFVAQLLAERHERARHIRRRRDRRCAEQRAGDRGHRLPGRAPRGQSRPQRRDDLARCGGQGDPLGGRPRCAGDQPELRRHARPGRQVARHVFAARGGCGPVRGQQRRPRRRCRRERGRRARAALGLRRLSGGAAARAGRERRRTRRLCARPSRTGIRSTTTSPLPARGSSRRCRGRSRRAPARAASSRVTPTAGRSSSAAARGRPSPHRRCPRPPRSSSPTARSSRPDQVAALLTRSANDAEPDSGCERCWPGRDSLTGWGVLDVARCGPGARRDASRGGPLRGQRRGRDRCPDLGPQGPAGSGRRSTTGTTRSTSTRSSFGAASVWWRGSAARAAPIRISSSGSLEHDGLQAPRSIAACSPRSPRLPARSSEFGCVRRRPAGTSSR